MSVVVTESLDCLTASETSPDPITRINTELEQAGSSLLWTERSVERHWTQALQTGDDRPVSWLLLVRLAEAALLCAGNYADNCEFRAAGDFLVNPREIVVHRRNGGRSAVKKRHGRLSEQFGFEGIGRRKATRRYPPDMYLEITKPPLIPLMTRFLRESGRVSASFVLRMEELQVRIADTVSFLAAWRIFDSAELWQRLKASSPRERAFVEAHLCRFDTQVFHRIGLDLRRAWAQPDYPSLFLTEPRADAGSLKRRSPAPARALTPALL